MLKLGPFATPPLWKFIDPDTQRPYAAQTKKELFDLIVAYREQNRLPQIEHLDIVIENYVCSLPENKGRCEPRTLNRSWQSYLQGGISLIKNFYYSQFASQEEAERRAAICVKCPHNVAFEKRSLEIWADTMQEACVGDRATTQDPLLHNCAICSCPLKAKVHYDGELELSDEERTKMREVGCWQPELENKSR